MYRDSNTKCKFFLLRDKNSTSIISSPGSPGKELSHTMRVVDIPGPVPCFDGVDILFLIVHSGRLLSRPDLLETSRKW